MATFDTHDPDSAPTLIPELCMRTILSAHIGKDSGGYDLLLITLDNGTVLEVHEQGQCGWFRHRVLTMEAPNERG